MKKNRTISVFCMMAMLLLVACGTDLTENVPTSAPDTFVITESPAVTEEPKEALSETTPAVEPEEVASTVVPTEEPENVVTTETPTTGEVDVTQMVSPTSAPAKATPIVTPAPTATPYPKASLNKGDLSYTFKDMTVCLEEGVDYTIDSKGSLDVQFHQSYAKIRMLFPESIDLAECVGLTLKMNCNGKTIDVCFFGEDILTDPECTESSARWGFPWDSIEGMHDYQCFPLESGEIYGIGFMVRAEDTDFSGYKFTIDNMTFHMTSGNKTDIPKDIAPNVTSDMTLLNTYGTVFDNIGAMVTLEQLENPATLREIKKQFNSVTMGYHLDYPFAEPLTFISVDEAKKSGYFIPADYPDEIVPKFDFSNWDKVLKICAENGLRLRGQASTCNGQIPKWFFSEGYTDYGDYVTAEEMNARNEFYIRTIMEYVYNSEYGDLVYSWDLINEYYNTDYTDWVKLYGTYSLTPDNLKRLYEAAADVLEKHGIRENVSLVFNNYNTYLVLEDSNVPEIILEIADYINSDIKAVDAIGMQGWMPSETSVAAVKNAMKKYLAAGYEVQFTEIDVPLLEQTDQQLANQTKIYSQVLKEALKLKMSGANITGVSFHIPADITPIKPEESAVFLLFLGRPKESYYGMLQAYAETINTSPYTPPKISANGELTYTPLDFDHLKLENYEDEPKFKVLADGALEIPFTFQYQGIRFGLPEGVDMSKCTGITFKIKTDDAGFAVELLNENTLFSHWEEPVYTDYGCRGDGIYEYTITPELTGSVHGISLMILNEIDQNTVNKATLYSVTFHMES